MYRVLVALLLTMLAVQLSGCTGSLRLGSDIRTLGHGFMSANL